MKAPSPNHWITREFPLSASRAATWWGRKNKKGWFESLPSHLPTTRLAKSPFTSLVPQYSHLWNGENKSGLITGMDFPGGSDGKESVYSRREWQPTPVFLPGEFHGQKSLAGYSWLGCIELGMTERLTHTHITAIEWRLNCIQSAYNLNRCIRAPLVLTIKWAGFLTSLSLHNLPYEMMKIISISQDIEVTMQGLEVTKVTSI